MRPGDNEGSGAPDTPPFEGIIGPKRPGTRGPMLTGPRRIRTTVALLTGLATHNARQATRGATRPAPRGAVRQAEPRATRKALLGLPRGA